jgi:hypothetical protein
MLGRTTVRSNQFLPFFPTSSLATRLNLSFVRFELKWGYVTDTRGISWTRH